MRKALGRVGASVGRFGHAATTFPQAVKGETGDLVQAAAEGLGLGGYRFDRYKSTNEHDAAQEGDGGRDGEGRREGWTRGGPPRGVLVDAVCGRATS